MIQPLWNLIILSISYIILIHYVTSEIEIIEIIEIQRNKKFLFFNFYRHKNPVSEQCKTKENWWKYDFLWSEIHFSFKT